MGLIRLLLALFVVEAHSGVLFGADLLRGVGGRTAVQLFYIISGFYMALILQERYVGLKAYRAFIVSRFLRLVPSYWIVCGLTLVFGVVVVNQGSPLSTPVNYWLNLGALLSAPSKIALLASNILIVGQDWIFFLEFLPDSGTMVGTLDSGSVLVPAYKFLMLPQAWTLGVEMTFYLLAPFMLRRHWLTVVAVLAGSLAIRLALSHGLTLPQDPWNYRFFPAELWLFLAGSLSYRAYTRLSGWLDNKAVLSVAVLVGFVALLFMGKVSYRLLLANGMTNQWLRVDAVCLMLPFALPFIFSVTRASRFDNYIGTYSYPVYTSHLLIVLALHAWGSAAMLGHMGEWACLLTLMLSFILVTGVERPIEAWRHRLVGRLMG